MARRIVIEEPCEHGRYEGHWPDRGAMFMCRPERRIIIDDFPTSDQLRYIADSLDLLARYFVLALPNLRVDGEPPDPDDVAKLREWAEGSAQQDDLRRWADALDG